MLLTCQEERYKMTWVFVKFWNGRDLVAISWIKILLSLWVIVVIAAVVSHWYIFSVVKDERSDADI